jgi:hypothetical protein
MQSILVEFTVRSSLIAAAAGLVLWSGTKRSRAFHRFLGSKPGSSYSRRKVRSKFWRGKTLRELDSASK